MKLPANPFACTMTFSIASSVEEARTHLHRASVNVVDAILVNVLTLDRRNLVQFHTIAIARATGVDALLFVGLSRRDSERLVITVARLHRCGWQRETNQEYRYGYNGKNSGFHVRTCSGLV